MALDVVIFGGGGAGLWLLDELVTARYRVLLLEAGSLGGGQTICCQGIIHGGLKYTLDGVLSKSASAIREMPDIWRACLAGRRSPDLSGTPVLAVHCYLWRTDTVRSRLGMIGARVGLRAAPQTVAADDRPAVLAQCPGAVVSVPEHVIDPRGFMETLAGRHRGRILRIDADNGLQFELDGPATVRAIRLTDPGSKAHLVLAPRAVILTAGAGNAALGERAGLPAPRGGELQQRRPLHMLLARGELPQLFGHCVDGAATRVTISSATDSAGRTMWQVGGQVAEDGVAMDQEQFIDHGAAEVRAALPGLDTAGIEWSSYRIDRAEAAASGRRPSDVSIVNNGNIIAAWPTKLALVPRLSEKIISVLQPPSGSAADDTDSALRQWPRPAVADPPWETASPWFTDR